MVDAVAGGEPLALSDRAFFEPRFGADFSGVRIHHDNKADAAARAVGASAYTRGNAIVFRAGHYGPQSSAGRHLLAHELTHVLQQGAAPRVHASMDQQHAPSSSNLVTSRGAPAILQLVPGDGMSPPGDCTWRAYAGLRGSVETAKAVVSMLGSCSDGDSCLFLATKIAAITAELAARVALDATCFKGGDSGHRQQVQDKLNMLSRCYRYFSGSKCSPELVAAMSVVVASARAVIAATAITVAAALLVALVAALVAAIVALVEVIAALAAAAAEAIAIAAAAASLLAVLHFVSGGLSGEEVPGDA